jgi:hypothetical protein
MFNSTVNLQRAPFPPSRVVWIDREAAVFPLVRAISWYNKFLFLVERVVSQGVVAFANI